MTSRAEQINTIRQLPDKLEALISGYTPEQLTTAYNAPEWTIAQNVHHLFDSHINSYVRMKLILVEDNPTLRPYEQDDFAALPDAKSGDISASLLGLRGLHARWAQMLDTVTDADWNKKGYHPENGDVTLGSQLDYYAAHCEAHLQQIQAVIDRMP